MWYHIRFACGKPWVQIPVCPLLPGLSYSIPPAVSREPAEAFHLRARNLAADAEVEAAMPKDRWAHGVVVSHPLSMRGPWVQSPVCPYLYAGELFVF